MGHGATPSSGTIVDSIGDAYDYTDFKLSVYGYTEQYSEHLCYQK